MWDRQNGPIVRTAFSAQMPDNAQTGNAPINYGCVPGSRLPFSVNPTTNDIVTIGGVQFKFLTALTTASAAVQIKLGASAALTLANFLDAINGKASTRGTAWLDATTPFPLALVADAVTATQLRLRMATTRGGLPMAGVSTSVALLSSVTGGAAAWSTTNLNVNGKSPSDFQQAYGIHTVTAAEVTAAFIDIELEFQPTAYDIYASTSVGALKSITELVTLPASQQSLHLTIGGGLATTNLIAGDIIYWWAAV